MFLLRPPDLLRREPLFEGTNVCNSQENCVRTPCAAIVNHYAIVNLLHRANLLRRSIFSTAGSFGYVFVRPFTRDAILRSFEKGLADRGGWREEIPPMPEIKASFLYPFSYAPLGEG